MEDLIKRGYVSYEDFGARELEFERWYDQGLLMDYIGRRVKQKTATGLADIMAM